MVRKSYRAAETAMAGLTFNASHNICMYAELNHEKTTQFDEAIQFMLQSNLHFALTANPIIFTRHVNDFWVNCAVEGENLVSNVQGRVVTVNEGVIRRTLRLNDEAGIEDLEVDEVHAVYRRMGFVGEFKKKMVKKNMLSYNWRFIAHTFLHCLSSRKGGFDEMSIPVATGLACLVTQRPYNFSSFIYYNMKRNVEEQRNKFLMYPRFLQLILNVELPSLQLTPGVLELNPMTWRTLSYLARDVASSPFSGDFTPFFPAMLALIAPEQQQEEVQQQQEVPEDDDVVLIAQDIPENVPLIISSDDDIDQTHGALPDLNVDVHSPSKLHGVYSANSPSEEEDDVGGRPGGYVSFSSSGLSPGSFSDNEDHHDPSKETRTKHRHSTSILPSSSTLVTSPSTSVLYKSLLDDIPKGGAFVPYLRKAKRPRTQSPVVSPVHEKVSTPPTPSSEFVPRAELEAAQLVIHDLTLENFSLKSHIQLLEQQVETLKSSQSSKTGGEKGQEDDDFVDGSGGNDGGNDGVFTSFVDEVNLSTDEVNITKDKADKEMDLSMVVVGKDIGEVKRKFVIVHWALNIINNTIRKSKSVVRGI